VLIVNLDWVKTAIVDEESGDVLVDSGHLFLTISGLQHCAT